MRHERLFAAAMSTPWAILPEHGRTVARILERIAGGKPVAEPIPFVNVTNRNTFPAAKSAKPGNRRRDTPAVALMGIYGTITQRADMFTDWSGGTSTETAGAHFDELASDPSIEAIVIDFDTPGGSVYGVDELANKIAAASKTKKCIGVVNSLCASAGYWIASQCSELCMTPGGECGSIGVYMMHEDISKALEEQGRKVTFVSAGERKVAANYAEPLSDLGRAELKEGVDDYYSKFVRAVSKGRKVSQQAVREGFGRGGMVRAEQALKEGMIDRICTLDEVLSRYGVKLSDFQMSAAADIKPDYEVELRRRKLKM